MKPEFKDFFSKQSDFYAKFRPVYPNKVYEILSSLCKKHELAWDGGTGNGQAALGLTPFFSKIIATDASSNQIEHAKTHAQIKYIICKAEQTPIENHSIDLITIAQAFHWFHFDKFYNEVKRVLKPKGILALWCYWHNRKISPTIDPIIKKYSDSIVHSFWPKEVQYVWDHYQTIPFPFEEIEIEKIDMTCEWDLYELMGYIFSWSATQRFIEIEKTNPMKKIQMKLLNAWGDPKKKRRISWPLYFRVGVHS